MDSSTRYTLHRSHRSGDVGPDHDSVLPAVLTVGNLAHRGGTVGSCVGLRAQLVALRWSTPSPCCTGTLGGRVCCGVFRTRDGLEQRRCPELRGTYDTKILAKNDNLV